MKVYVVTNEALYHNSSYFDVLDVFQNKEDAINCIGCIMKDFMKQCDEGVYPEFETYTIEEPQDGEYSILGLDGQYYESWYIEERIVK